jgi:hypothetical protein
MVIFDNELVFHSNKTGGVHITSLKDLPKSELIVEQYRPVKPLSLGVEESIYQALIRNVVGRSYDLPALVYLGFRVALKKFFGMPIPKHNLFDIPGEAFCSEAIQEMNRAFEHAASYSLFKESDLSMISPSTLLQLARDNKALERYDG